MLFLLDESHAPLNTGAQIAGLVFHLLKTENAECSFEIVARPSHQCPADGGEKVASVFGGKRSSLHGSEGQTVFFQGILFGFSVTETHQIWRARGGVYCM